MSFKLATGKLRLHPFLRRLWTGPARGSRSWLGPRMLHCWLTKVSRSSWGCWLLVSVLVVDDQFSFSSGVYVGEDMPLPRTPQVFPPKDKQKKLDESEFNPIAENYSSAQLSAAELEAKFREEESLGRMFPSKLSVLQKEYGDRLRVASMAAIVKPDGGVRPLHDATHSVKVNNSIVYQDRIQCPARLKLLQWFGRRLRWKRPHLWYPLTSRRPIDLSRCVKMTGAFWHAVRTQVRRRFGWIPLEHSVSVAHLTGGAVCLLVWAGMSGIYSITSLCFSLSMWTTCWGRLSEFENFSICGFGYWLLSWLALGTPFGYHKFSGGFAANFVGYHIRYDLQQVGITAKGGEWLVNWIKAAADAKFVVQARDFREFLGRLGFVAQLLVWLEPDLAPLYAWGSAVAPGTVGKLPETIVLTLLYISLHLKRGSFLLSVKRPVVFSKEAFRTDAKCEDGRVVLGGWERSGEPSAARWFHVEIKPDEAPFLFREEKSQWASTSAELLASLAALHAFGWLQVDDSRKSLSWTLVAQTILRINFWLPRGQQQVGHSW